MANPDMESVSWLRFALASVSVLGLMALLAFALKLMASRGWLKARSTAGRLQLLASLPLDSRRRIVLTQCDDREYVILLGASNDVLLSSAPASSPSPDPVSPP